ncbi:FliH/SctL family protein [Spongisporangium articulatum]|uniref:FliH/SctL family protein n=1 Tax=Spongisporangium articulatum TaxID=3362603 RepID=A0ABW8AHN1_9ACTN
MTPPANVIRGGGSRVVARGARLGTPVVDASTTEVRPANLDHPLRRTAINPTYSDPVLDDIVAESARAARDDARAQGYAAGWAQGRQAAAVEAAQVAAATAAAEQQRRDSETAQFNGLLARLADAARDARTVQVAEWQDVAAALAETAVQLAVALLDRELAATDDAVLEGVLAALARVADPDAAVVHLNPADLRLVTEPPAGVRLVPDAAVNPGDVLVLTPAQRLVRSLPEALAAAREVLAE